jgi:hypothetical protein
MDLVQLEGLGKLKHSSTSSGLEPATSQLVAYCFLCTVCLLLKHLTLSSDVALQGCPNCKQNCLPYNSFYSPPVDNHVFTTPSCLILNNETNCEVSCDHFVVLLGYHRVAPGRDGGMVHVRAPQTTAKSPFVSTRQQNGDSRLQTIHPALSLA